MCCKNKSRRSGGCHSRRYNNNNTLPFGTSQDPVIVYERRPSLFGMLAQHIAAERQAKKELGMGYEAKQVSFLNNGKWEDQKMIEERNAQAMWEEKMGVSNGTVGVGRGVDHVDRRSQDGENNRFSGVSVGTELPSYGQVMKQ